MSRSLSAVVVAYRSASHLPGLISDLEREGVDEILVVDNASPDDSAAVAAASSDLVRVVSMTCNAGFAAGVNRGVAESHGDVLLLVNPDVRLEAGCVKALLDAADRRPGAVLGPVVRDREGRLLPTRRSLPSIGSLLGEEVLMRERAAPGRLPQRIWARWGAYDREVDAPVLSGVCLLVPRSVWEEVGPMDEGYFLYWEEVDWQLRARARGHPTWLVPAAAIVHARSASLGLHDERRAALMGRATRRFLRLHLSAGRRTAALGLLALGQVVRWILWSGISGVRRDERAVLRRRQHGAWLRGVWACGRTS